MRGGCGHRRRSGASSRTPGARLLAAGGRRRTADGQASSRRIVSSMSRWRAGANEASVPMIVKPDFRTLAPGHVPRRLAHHPDVDVHSVLGCLGLRDRGEIQPWRASRRRLYGVLDVASAGVPLVGMPCSAFVAAPATGESGPGGDAGHQLSSTDQLSSTAAPFASSRA